MIYKILLLVLGLPEGTDSVIGVTVCTNKLDKSFDLKCAFGEVRCL